LLTLFSFMNINAQNFELGKVSIAELQEKVYPIDTSAVAAILFKKGRTFFVYKGEEGYIVNHEYEFKIKIYKTKGLDWANFYVPIFIENESLENKTIKFLDCNTYNLKNDKVEITKLKEEGHFIKKINNVWNEYAITMPNVKVGSIIEIKYKLGSKNKTYFPVFNFQYQIPVNHFEYITDIPQIYKYKPIVTGYCKVDSNVNLIEERESYAHKFNMINGYKFKYFQSKYMAENIPALISEDFLDNVSNYRGSIQNELEYIRLSNDKFDNYSMTWEGVAKNIYEFSSFGKELEKKKYFENDLNAILKTANNDYEKLMAIFKFVQNKMNWDNHLGIFTKKGVKKAFSDGTGNVAEINFILISMLNDAGIETFPVLISTRKNGVAVFPNRTGFNSVIGAAQIDGKKILLDASNKFTTVNILPFEDLNWTGRLIKKDGTSQEINLVPNLPSKINNTLLTTIDDSGKIVGKVRIQKTDYEAYGFREKNAQFNKDNYLEKLENDLNGIQIDDYVVENMNADLSKPVTETFTFATDNQCEIIRDKMFVNLMLFFTLNKNPFVQEKRQTPIYFGFPKQEKYNIRFEIPKGYIVESIPKPIKISTADNVAFFSINVLLEGNVIQIAITKEINSAIVSADFYDILKEFYQKIIDKQNEKIVLKKIQL
jgi:hypothetical protein